MENKLLQKRVPTVIGVLLLAGGLIAGVVLVGKSQLLTTRAGPTAIPRNVRVLNRASSSFKVAWVTDTAVTGFVRYSDDPANLSLTAGDRRDQLMGTTNPYTTHYVEVAGLTPNKVYYFEIGSGSQIYNDTDKPYQTRTIKDVTAQTEDLISGKILNNEGVGAGGALVMVEIDGGETLGDLSDNDGSWRLNLTNMINPAGERVDYDPKQTVLTIFVDAGDGGTATALTNTDNDNPVPDITLGQTHNFVPGAFTALVPDTIVTESIGQGGFSQYQNTGGITFSYPAFDGEEINTRTPQIIGTATPDETVYINIDDVSGQALSQAGGVVVGTDGVWRYSFENPLDVGNYVLGAEYKTQGVDIQRVERRISVVNTGVGGVPAFTASGSATPYPTIPMATDSGVVSSFSLTPTVTITPNIATESSMVASTSSLPDVGVMTPTYWLLGSGMFLFASGLLWRRRMIEI